MKIGIIGAGNIGSTLARKLAASGHEVKLANSKGPDTICDLARDVGATAVSKEEAGSAPSLSSGLHEHAAQAATAERTP